MSNRKHKIAKRIKRAQLRVNLAEELIEELIDCSRKRLDGMEPTQRDFVKSDLVAIGSYLARADLELWKASESMQKELMS